MEFSNFLRSVAVSFLDHPVGFPGVNLTSSLTKAVNPARSAFGGLSQRFRRLRHFSLCLYYSGRLLGSPDLLSRLDEDRARRQLFRNVSE